jgi:hypothetical protein
VHFGSNRTVQESDGVPKRSSLSKRGPGCSGSLTAITKLGPRTTEMVSNARFGAMSLTLRPYRHPYARLLASTTMSGGLATALSRKDGKGCACGYDGEVDIWHYLFECTEAAVSHTASQIKRKVRGFILKLCDKIDGATGNAVIAAGYYRPPPLTRWSVEVACQRARCCSCTAEVGATLHTLRAADMCDSDINMQWMTYLLILAVPWSRLDDSVPGVCPLPGQLGALFDEVFLSNSELRPVADFWVRWSAQQLKSLAGCSKRAQRQADARRRASLRLRHAGPPTTEEGVDNGFAPVQ